jgi:hypothetical protein
MTGYKPERRSATIELVHGLRVYATSGNFGVGKCAVISLNHDT